MPAASPSVPPSVVPPYLSNATTYDEMVAPDGSVRPHWQGMAAALSRTPPADFASRTSSIKRLLQDHGVTYNVYDDAVGTRRPWELDQIPFIVSESDFDTVSAGLQQRVRLLEAILSDLYGPQRLLKENHLPAQLIFANVGFLRAVLGVQPPGGRFLSLYGCDVVRGTNGRWMVLADRTQSPSAHGYTLENRIILSNVLSEEFHGSHVHRLKNYFDQMRVALQNLSPQGRIGQAGILMLTPGPQDETYFEHAFQARYLGFPLVEGADLTVRDRRVWLKTLEGLKRVDVILRHVDDEFCDDLELRSNCRQGTPGLTEAWRNGSVSLANGLGVGVVETPALNPFLPNLCRLLLSQELQLGCVPTWWCGQPRELKQVLDHPTRWVLKPAFMRGARAPLFLADLSKTDLANALTSLQAAPHEWVAQERLTLSTTPTLINGTIQPRPLVWRLMATATGPNRYHVLPGGLTRVSPSADSWVVTMRSGAISKDTWVIAPKPVTQDANLAPRTQPTIRPARPPSAVPSRAADHLFWLGRYTERLEQTVRLLRSLVRRQAGEGSPTDKQEIQTCLEILSERKLLILTKGTTLPAWQPLMQDPQVPGSLTSLIRSVQYNAAAARDRLSDDTWRLLNRLDDDAPPANAVLTQSTMLACLDSLILDLAAFGGMHLDNVTRGHGWRFLEIGRRLERATTHLETLGAGAGMDAARLVPLLEICDSTMTFRRLHFAAPTLPPVLDLLLLDESNPRSVAFQVSRLSTQINQLPVEEGSKNSGREQQLLQHLTQRLQTFSISQLSQQPGHLETALKTLCADEVATLEDLSNTLTERYFSHAKRQK